LGGGGIPFIFSNLFQLWMAYCEMKQCMYVTSWPVEPINYLVSSHVSRLFVLSWRLRQ